ncbi:MAG: hypothetical protein KAJ75_09600 [Alphaproteobacteria bacterium]|nr:hypothetical protein [Alphaproteobacteria bacterium]
MTVTETDALGIIREPIKTAPEAKQAVESFAKKGSIKTFICGAAKMLEGKSISNSIDKMDSADRLVVVGTMTVCAALASTLVSNASVDVVEAGMFIGGAAVLLDSIRSVLNDKPALLERIIKVPKNIKNFVNEAMEKGGR